MTYGRTHPAPVCSDLRRLTYLLLRGPYVSSSSSPRDGRGQPFDENSPDTIPRICSPFPTLTVSCPHPFKFDQESLFFFPFLYSDSNKQENLIESVLSIISIISLLVRPRYLFLALTDLGLTDFCSSSNIASSSLPSLSPQITGFSFYHL